MNIYILKDLTSYMERPEWEWLTQDQEDIDKQ